MEQRAGAGEEGDAGSGAPTSTPRLTPTIQIGKFKLTGTAATVVAFALIGALIGAVIARSMRPGFHWSPLWISVLFWLIFNVYWTVAALKAAPTRRAESQGSRRIHELLLNWALLLLFIPVPGLRARWLPDSPWIVDAALVLQALSLALMIWSRRHLGRNWSGAITEKVDHELVRSGPYRILRHPIYTGFLGMYLFTAAVSGELHALLGVVIAIIAYARKIPMEEQNLDSVFGDAYAEYRKTSWALVPGIY
ncbi:MAG TPA: isoprenylcysteine carboxylmethyltransferase family protein [Candidatus Udaeobacter sp.]|jgi:protein-S-isoprenylcysteine O-methyltransferase Ste14|nr:isoprenylcysteine carboxylmethyltransferase family protein [Candidatus Udaeobacter sp.]